MKTQKSINTLLNCNGVLHVEFLFITASIQMIFIFLKESSQRINEILLMYY